ncbi:MAG TPA: hypothetical protein VM307_03520, partial [Egibacteraceae bacterium]|nr:hypothetical protein [Egibacteraceae bacterium]
MVVVLVLLAAGCSGGDGLRAGDAATVAEGSAAEVFTADRWEPLDAGASVVDGARVRANQTEAELSLRGGSVRLAPGAAAVVRPDRVELERGDVLSDGVDVVVGDTTVSGDGLFRASTGLASRVAVYTGAARVVRPSQERQVPALRQLDLAAFRLAAVADPLRYREGDPWDLELLAEALAFDAEAARLSRGIELELGSDPLRPRVYRRFAEPTVVSVLASTAAEARGPAFGPPSDVLLTMFVAQAAAGDTPVHNVVRRVADLRDDGARWGLIAVELDV